MRLMGTLRGAALAATTIASLALAGCLAPLPDDTETSAPPVVTSEAPAPVVTEAPTTEAAPDVPSEWTAALESATSYLDFSSFSKQGLYDQLTSEFGDQFPADAAQYAVDNVEVDWNAEALEAAISYRDNFSMSNADIHDQLTSEFGDQFTASEADYAVANLP